VVSALVGEDALLSDPPSQFTTSRYSLALLGASMVKPKVATPSNGSSNLSSKGGNSGRVAASVVSHDLTSKSKSRKIPSEGSASRSAPDAGKEPVQDILYRKEQLSEMEEVLEKSAGRVKGEKGGIDGGPIPTDSELRRRHAKLVASAYGGGLTDLLIFERLNAERLSRLLEWKQAQEGTSLSKHPVAKGKHSGGGSGSETSSMLNGSKKMTSKKLAAGFPQKPKHGGSTQFLNKLIDLENVYTTPSPKTAMAQEHPKDLFPTLPAIHYFSVKQSIGFLNESLEFFMSTGERYFQAVSLLVLGTISLRNDDVVESLPLLERATVIFDELAEPVGAFHTLMTLGEWNLRMGKLPEAQRLLTSLLPNMLELTGPTRSALVSLTLGNIHLIQKDKQGAYNKYLEAAPFLPSKGRLHHCIVNNDNDMVTTLIKLNYIDVTEAFVLIWMGDIYFRRRHFAQARRLHDFALQILKEQHEHVGAGMALLRLGWSRLVDHNDEVAFQDFQLATQILDPFRNRQWAEARLAVAQVLVKTSSGAGMVDIVEEAMLLYESRGDALGLNWGKKIRGDCHVKLGNAFRAEVDYAEAAEGLDMEHQGRIQRGETLLSWGHFLFLLAKFEESTEKLAMALEISRMTRDLHLEGRTQLRQGALLVVTHQWIEANDVLLSSLSIFQRLDDAYHVGECMLELANIQLERYFDTDAALKLIGAAMTEFKKIQHRDGRMAEAYAIVRISEILFHQNKDAACQEHLDFALTTFRAYKDTVGEALCFYTMGLLQTRQHLPQDAQKSFETSYLILQEHSFHVNRCVGRTILAYTRLYLNEDVFNLGVVEQFISRTEDVLESVMDEVFNGQLLLLKVQRELLSPQSNYPVADALLDVAMSKFTQTDVPFWRGMTFVITGRRLGNLVEKTVFRPSLWIPEDLRSYVEGGQKQRREYPHPAADSIHQQITVAVQQYQEAVTIFAALPGAKQHVGDTYREIARLHCQGTDDRNFSLAKECYEKAAASYRSIQVAGWEAEVFNEWGELHIRRRELEESQRPLENALAIYRQYPEKFHRPGLIVLQVVAQVKYQLLNFRGSCKLFELGLEMAQAQNDQLGEADMYMLLGDNLGKLDRIDDAHKVYRTAIPVMEKLKDKNREALAYFHLGELDVAALRYEKALGYFQAALRVYQDINDQNRICSTYMALGNVKMSQKDYLKAEHFYILALRAYREVEDIEGEAKALEVLGETKILLGEYDDALNNMGLLIEQFQESDHPEREAVVHLNIGRVYIEKGFYAQAELALKKTKQILTEVIRIYREKWIDKTAVLTDEEEDHGPPSDPRILMGDTHMYVGDVRIKMKDYSAAVLDYTRSLDTYRSAHHHAKAAKISLMIASLKIFLNSPDEAEVYYAHALQCFSDCGDEVGVAMTYRDMGRLKSGEKNPIQGAESSAWEDLLTAASFFSQARDIYDRLHDVSGSASIMILQSQLDSKLGNIAEAESTAVLAAKLLSDLKDPRELEARDNLARIRAMKGDMLGSIKMLQTVLATQKSRKDRLGEGKTRMAMGKLQAQLHEYERSLEMLEESLNIFRAKADMLWLSKCLKEIGDIRVMQANQSEKVRKEKADRDRDNRDNRASSSSHTVGEKGSNSSTISGSSKDKDRGENKNKNKEKRLDKHKLDSGYCLAEAVSSYTELRDLFKGLGMKVEAAQINTILNTIKKDSRYKKYKKGSSKS
jgi:tetratricopeptide (TPR) repeat protein